MRFVAAIVLGMGSLNEADAKNLLSSSIKPHARFLIQSVLESKTATRYNLERKADVDSDAYCQPASTFLTVHSKKQTHEYFTKQADSAVTASKATRTFLSELEDLSRRDDVRRALQMQEIWGSTIIAELTQVKKAVDEKIAAYTKQVGHLDTIKGKKGPGDPSEHLQVSKDAKPAGQWSTSQAEESLAMMANEGTDSLHGVLAHTDGEWDSFKASYETAKGKLEKLSGDITTLSVEAATIFASHVQEILTADDYKLKWSASADGGDAVETRKGSSAGSVPTDLAVDAAAYNYKSGDKAKNEDDFDDEKAASLGKAIVARVAGLTGEASGQTFEAFIKAEGSPSETMDRLTTTLNVLQIRRLGLMDAKKSLVDLLKKVNEKMGMIHGQMIAKMAQVETGMVETNKYARVVYADAKKFANVDINEGLLDMDGKDPLDTMMDELRKLDGTDAHAQIPMRIKLSVNQLYRLHAHLLAFIDAVKSTGSGESFKLVNSNIEDIVKQVGELNTQLQATEAPKAVQYSAIKTQLEEWNAQSRIAADCLLYGRMDALMHRAVLTTEQGVPARKEAELCGATHTYGVEVLKKALDVTANRQSFMAAIKALPLPDKSSSEA